MGRPTTPTNLKIMKGTARPCRLNKDEPKPAADKVKPPRDLSKPAKKHWREISEQLEACGILTNIDIHALTMYCESYASWKESQRSISEDGMVLKGLDGIPYINPHFKLAGKYFDQCKAMLVEFGMTPSSRAKVSKAEKDEKPKDPWSTI